MIDWASFSQLLQKYAKKPDLVAEDELFGGGINLSSIGFTEFIMDLEEKFDLDIDVDGLDASVKTVGQLFARLTSPA